MLQPCQDNYSTTFASYEGMRRYHVAQMQSQ